MKNRIQIILIGVMIFLLAACTNQITPAQTDTPRTTQLKVVATTSIVGDVVAQVGGDLIDLTVLLPAGTDPHSYSPTPQDAARLADADVIFANGAGLESFLSSLLDSADSTDKLVEVSDGISYLEGSEDEHTDEQTEGEVHDQDIDPHTWSDPNNVKIWVQNIQNALSSADPGNSAAYQTNADDYSQQLDELDAWIREQVSQIPEDQRNLVTDHMEYGYFAEEYGFTMVGAVIPGYSTLSEPSAMDLANLLDAIRSLNVKAVFVGNTVNPKLAGQVASDTGTKLVHIYSGSLAQSGDEASTYLGYMRYNVNAIVGALK